MMKNLVKNFGGGGHRSLVAFTLAEVLITLTIIGVVAALTIPTVILKVNEHQYVVGLKKATSILSQAATTKYAKDNIAPIQASSMRELKDLFANQMSVIDQSAGDAEAQEAPSDDAAFDNSGIYLTTADGMQFIFPSYFTDDSLGFCTCLFPKSLCPVDNGGTQCQRYNRCLAAPTYTTKEECMPHMSDEIYWISQCMIPTNDKGAYDENPCSVIVDVNGSKGPNVLTTSVDAPKDRYILKIAGPNGTSVLPVGAAAELMRKK